MLLPPDDFLRSFEGEAVVFFYFGPVALGNAWPTRISIKALTRLASRGERGSESSSNWAAAGSAHSTWCRCSASETLAEEAAAEGGSKFMIFHFNCQYSRLKKLAKRYQKTHSPCVFLQGFCQTDHHLAHHLIGPIHFPRGSRKPMSYWSGKPRQLPSLQSPEGLRLGEFTDEVFLLYTTSRWWFGQILFFSPLLGPWNSETISFWFPPTTGHLQDDANF